MILNMSFGVFFSEIDKLLTENIVVHMGKSLWSRDAVEFAHQATCHALIY